MAFFLTRFILAGMLNFLKSPVPALGLTGLLLFTGLIYFPALDGLFLLDDFQSLKDLGEIESRGLSFYLYGTSAGPGGRPLSLLSFALQYPSWPADPYAFKLVNLLLHLANGALIYYLCSLILPAFKLNPPAGRAFSLSVTALWLLHPMQLSTVLYVVQRMTVLATTFMLAGTLIYLVGRKLYLEGESKKGLFMILAGTYLCMVLAILSKETGVLLPLYLLVLEFTLLSDRQSGPRWHRYIVPFLLLPLMIFAGYLLQGYQGLMAAYTIRDYTVTERLLTETNVLIEYLRVLFIPTSGSFSIFHDDYRIATGLLTPPITLFSILVILLLLTSALAFRKHAKVYSFAVFWFFAGHVLESSFIGLEIYFEHRNYLPSLGIFIFIIWGLGKLAGKLKTAMSGRSIIPLYLIAILSVTLMEIGLWSDPNLQAQEWARHHPQSKRALNNLLNINLILGNQQETDDVIKRMQELDNGDIYPTIKIITIRSCYDGETLTEPDWILYNTSAATAMFRGISVISELEYLVYQSTHNFCDGLDAVGIRSFIETLIKNPEFGIVRGELHEIAATYAVIEGNLDIALLHLNTAIGLAPDIDRKIYKLRILVARKETAQSAGLLQEIKEQLQERPRDFYFFRDTITDIENQLTTVDGKDL